MNEPVQDKTPKPAGLVPKNVQSWLVIGLAVLMVLIMWLTGGKKPQSAAKSTSPAAQPETPLEVNQTKINELQNRIEEFQRRQELLLALRADRQPRSVHFHRRIVQA